MIEQIDKAIKTLKKIDRFSPFFVSRDLKEVIESLEKAKPTICGHCKYMKYLEKENVFYCGFYDRAKPWDGYCEKGEPR